MSPGPHASLTSRSVYCPQALARAGVRDIGPRVKGAVMDILIPIIGVVCIGLLIYYIYILMRSDS